MSKINVLSFEIANLIAAGEVVERPSSVLKELIENSIDSGATSIVAEIKKGGVALIRVTDNGCGIEKEDLPIALKRHATSKISSKEDLDSIMTLGFRGEALAAISSVSSMTIISKTKDAESATMLVSEAGRVIDISEVGAMNGTTVVVENLFGNVPARRKFLKKDATEAMNVTALVEKVAVSHPEISIQLLIDGEQKFKTPGDGKLHNAIYSVFGKEFASKTIKAEGIANGIKVWGYIGRSDNVRKNRNLQNFFINGRYVKSMTAMAAIEKAYTSYIAPECFPTCVLFIEMNPAIVDVNVHPAKLEVKFSDERSVFEAVYYTVKDALEGEEYRPEMTLKEKKGDYNVLGAFVPIGQDTKGEQIKLSIDPKAVPSAEKRVETNFKATAPIEINLETASPRGNDKVAPSYSNYREELYRPIKVASPQDKNESVTRPPLSAQELSPKTSIDILNRYKTSIQSVDDEIKAKSEDKSEDHSGDASESIQPKIDHKIIGEMFDCYVIVEFKNEILIIDKHAAHERILFEDLKEKALKDGRISTQKLLLPITVLLSPVEISTVREYLQDITSTGFEISIGEKNVDLLAIPNAISAQDAENLFAQMVLELADGRGNPMLTDAIRKEKALYQVACKAAIKGGRNYDRSIIEWLVDKLLALPDITVCPHGRPVAYKLTKNEIDRQFSRIK